ncbi:PSME3-interacting protein [Gastrophryne carolinensis]
MASHEGDLTMNKRFVTESELEERRKKRQEEWEKVRKPEDPEECPEEVYDPRSLYERLQEQKDKKQQEYEEQFKFKNMVRGLEEDETNFLDEVSRKQMLLEKERRDEERKELNEFRISFFSATSTEHKKREPEKKPLAKVSDNKNKFCQSKLLAGAVRHRSNSESSGAKKLKLDQDHQDKLKENHTSSIGSIVPAASRLHCPPASVCIGILPGLGDYSGSSDSESSSDGETTANNLGKIVSSVFRSGTYLEAP